MAKGDQDKFLAPGSGSPPPSGVITWGSDPAGGRFSLSLSGILISKLINHFSLTPFQHTLEDTAIYTRHSLRSWKVRQEDQFLCT